MDPDSRVNDVCGIFSSLKIHQDPKRVFATLFIRFIMKERTAINRGYIIFEVVDRHT